MMHLIGVYFSISIPLQLKDNLNKAQKIKLWYIEL